jgi:hypothetical protein
MMSAEVWIGGHSLGASRASIYAYSRVTRGLPVTGVYTFGCPRPGNSELGRALASIPHWRAIRNGSGGFPDYDLVTAVPFDVEFLLDYAQPAPFEECAEMPEPGDPWGLFRFHHIELYQDGCQKLPLTGSGAGVELVEAVDAVADLYYGPSGQWDWQHFIDGEFWGMRVMPSGARLMIARGTTTPHEWMQDLDTNQVQVGAAHVSRGFWAGVGPVLSDLDAALA